MKRIAFLLASTGLVAAAGAANATVYLQDHNLADFETGSYGTFSNYSGGQSRPGPYTPTNADLAAGHDVYAGKSLPGLSKTNNWVLVTFANPTQSIRVFPLIDQYGTWDDGYQYAIEGSNNGTTWTPLFDALTVIGTSEPFTLGTFTGTAPTQVDNVLTAAKNNHVGYIADFTFSAAYKYYAFGASTAAFTYSLANAATVPPARGEKPEFSAVAALSTVAGATGGLSPVPEPASWAMMLTGIGAMGLVARRRRTAAAA
jgi:hypothetical protein